MGPSGGGGADNRALHTTGYGEVDLAGKRIAAHTNPMFRESSGSVLARGHSCRSLVCIHSVDHVGPWISACARRCHGTRSIDCAYFFLASAASACGCRGVTYLLTSSCPPAMQWPASRRPNPHRERRCRTERERNRYRAARCSRSTPSRHLRPGPSRRPRTSCLRGRPTSATSSSAPSSSSR